MQDVELKWMSPSNLFQQSGRAACHGDKLSLHALVARWLGDDLVGPWFWAKFAPPNIVDNQLISQCSMKVTCRVFLVVFSMCPLVLFGPTGCTLNSSSVHQSQRKDPGGFPVLTETESLNNAHHHHCIKSGWLSRPYRDKCLLMGIT